MSPRIGAFNTKLDDRHGALTRQAPQISQKVCTGVLIDGPTCMLVIRGCVSVSVMVVTLMKRS